VNSAAIVDDISKPAARRWGCDALVPPRPRRRRDRFRRKSGVGHPEALLVVMAFVCAIACANAPARSDSARSAVSLPSPWIDQARWRTPGAAYQTERTRCIDRELARRNLNDFGDAWGTTYAHGAPQGVTTTSDRYNYVLKRRPDIATSCTRVPDELE
jgi:hypothetical protein